MCKNKGRLTLKGYGGVQIAVHIPEKKGKPAAVSVYDYEGLGTATAQKTFFKVGGS